FFTERARRVMILANQEAQRFNYEYIGTEHILLGLVEEGSGVAANVLKNLNVNLRTVRLEVEKIVQSGPDMVTMGKLPQTPRAKKVIEYAIEEARNLKHHHVGTKHLLLGILREEEGVAAQVLMNLGLGLEDGRAEVLHLLGQKVEPRTYPRPFPKEDIPDYPAVTRQALEELDARIAQLNAQKEGAVAAQDFEWAAHLRDQADKLNKEKRPLPRTWHLDYTIDPSWLTRNGGAAPKMAEVIGAERRWEDLPILADALEEAGCTHAEMLAHCRAGARHARRCWVVDLLRGAVRARRTPALGPRHPHPSHLLQSARPPRRQVAELVASDRHAHQPPHPVAHRPQHPPNLAVAPFRQDHLQRRRSAVRPQHAHRPRARQAVVQLDALPPAPQPFRPRAAGDGDVIRFRDVVLRLRQAHGEGGVGGEDQQALRVGVEAAGREDPRQARRQQVVHGAPAALVAARRDDAARLVQ